MLIKVNTRFAINDAVWWRSRGIAYKGNVKKIEITAIRTAEKLSLVIIYTVHPSGFVRWVRVSENNLYRN